MATTKAYFKVLEKVSSSPDQTLVLVGTALDGPSHKPFSVSTLKRVEDIIGDSPLSKAYAAAALTGLENIVLYRINGSHSKGSLIYDGTQTVMEFESVGAGTDYNNITIDVGPDKVVATCIDGTERIYFFSNYPSVGTLADAMNLDASFGLLEFTVIANDRGFLLAQFDENHPYTVIFTGGSTENDLILNRTGDIRTQINTLQDRLTEALFGGDPDDQLVGEPNSTLGLMEYGVLCLVDMFHDDPANFTELLAMFCQNKSRQVGSGCLGVLGTAPIFGNITDQVLTNKASALKANAPNAGSTATVEVDNIYQAKAISYVQIVVGDTTVSSILGETVAPTSLAYAYAATQAFLPYNSTLTNKTLAGVNNINYEFGKKDVEDLCSNGYISIVSSIRKGFVPYNAVTAIGNGTSMMKSPSVVRITQMVTKQVTNYLDDYVGSSSSAISRNALATGINLVIQDFVERKIVKDFRVALEYLVPTSEAQVHISIVPFASIGTVSSTINMPFNRGVIQ